jgi:hypothetical protein
VLSDRELWLFINSFADWLAAFGTIAAVSVALYFALRDARIRLKVVVGLRLLLQRGANERPEFFSIEVTNIGRRPARIVSIGMRDGLRFRIKGFGFGSHMVVIPSDHEWSARVPTTLNDGERAHYLFPWSDYARQNGDTIRRHFSGRLGWIRARLLRVGVYTSAGGTFDVRMERQLVDRLVALANPPQKGKPTSPQEDR